MQEDFRFIFIVVIAAFLLIGLICIVLSLLFYRRAKDKNAKELKDSVQQEMLIAQLEITENTLNTISQEIHDNIGQVLSLAKLNLSKVLIKESSSDAEKINATKNLIGKAIQDLRNLSKTLSTNYIEDHNLSQLIQADIAMMEKMANYKIHVHLSGDESLLHPRYRLIVYRIIQEALTNIVKHAQANRIEILIAYLPDALRVTIQDDGIGFNAEALPPPTDVPPGTGIRNMENRTRLIGGSFSIEGKVGGGTVLNVILPFNTAT